MLWMKRVSTAELKAHLGTYLGMVREGETVYITSHRRPVAQLSPSRVDESLTIQPPTLPMSGLKKVKGIQPSSGADGLKELLNDRQRR
jgi:prevent-host-death family protein